MDGPTPFVCEAAEIVEDEEAEEEREVAEFVRCALFRGMNILKSSALIGLRPLGLELGALHPGRAMFWKFGGGATAVIDCDGREC